MSKTSEPNHLSGLLTLREAASLINVHPNTLRNWEKEGKIEAVRLGNRRDRRFRRKTLEDICT